MLPYPFTGMILLRLLRKIPQEGAKNIELCGSAGLTTRGKKFCPESKQILEDILYDKVCEVLQLDEFDNEVFQSEIENILVLKPNVLTFLFKDGHEQTVRWLDHSRTEAWTPEMRKKSR